ncbi:hypothetical protein [Aeromicrobium sp. IC_218]|uniref:hypothetical protein n=1 Tax=Aeromicrobium sp. IC_218 TaxID=2545468 RepID=UPI00103AE382|nr:hypothetical protein [Aeromicrobium sp. IC_218]TCI95941.1 hypothetical protein E0W78_15570 [Aeromicrobium sp. IC_218]
MPLGSLSNEQGFALIAECTSTRNLLGYGSYVVRDAPFWDTTRDPVLTMLSIGMEKLHKLALGLIVLDDEGSWPAKAAMKDWGHGIAAMHHRLLPELVRRAGDASPFVRAKVGAIASNVVVPPLIRVLDLYGRSGRFFYLDSLARSPQVFDPAHAWGDVENAARDDPHVSNLMGNALERPADQSAWDSLRSAQNERIASAIEVIWEAISSASANGVLGEVGRMVASELAPTSVGRQRSS